MASRTQRGSWRKGQIDILSVSDSFTRGGYAPPDKNATVLIRYGYSNTLNLEISISESLDELARVKEYLGDLQPEVILWFYYEGNDLDNLITKGLGISGRHPSVRYL